MEETAALGHAAVVLDDVGHYEAIAVADKLAEQGVQIHFVTRFGDLGLLVDSSLSADPARQRLSRQDFVLHPHSQLVSISDGSAVVRSLDSEHETTLDVSSAVLVSGGWPLNGLAAELDDLDVRPVGDALGPRFMMTAIHEGHHAARVL
jgi:hypothetical protein